MPALVLFDEFILNLGNGNIDLDSHTFKAVLSNTAPVFGTDDELADITQIANGNGYLTGGVALASVTLLESGAGTGIWIWTAADITWTASVGSIATFRYVPIYDDTSANDKLVGYWDYGGAVNITVGNSFVVDIGASGILQLLEP